MTIKPIDFEKINNLILNFESNNNLTKFKHLGEVNQLKNIINQSKLLSKKYDVVVTNPPYMGNNGMNPNLKEYIKSNYPLTKVDLFAVFLEKGLEMIKEYGFNCMVTMQSWMFLSSFEKFRKKLIETTTISNLLHMENMVMRIAFGTSATIFRKTNLMNYNSTFYHVKLSDVENDIVDPLFFNDKNEFITKQFNFDNIPGNPIAYWATQETYDHFKRDLKLKDYVNYSGSLHKTANNEKYLRYFWEINKNDPNWRHYNKGGKFRKWYGNNELLVNWSNDSVKYYSTHQTANLFKKDFWDVEGITWTALTSGNFNARYFERGFISDFKGASIYPKNNLKYVLGLMNSCVFSYFLEFISPTIDFNIGQIVNVPFIYDDNFNENLVNENIKIEKKYWDKLETSFDFKCNNFTQNLIAQNKMEKIFIENCYEFKEDLIKLKNNEIEINKFFIDSYNLKKVLSPIVDINDISLYSFEKNSEIVSFISYAVGCMFGRYSLDNEGLQFAGGEFDISHYHKFIPDDDNIIPALDTAYFEDDIVGKFVEFVKTCFGEEHLEENLDFIANAIAKNKKPSREKIRDYMLKNFFNDHKKTYKKCPIYWQFSSGKQNGFNCLVYMHRYEPSLVARIRTDYLHKTQKAIEQAIANCDNIINHSSSNTEITKATKDKNKLQKQLNETIEYDEALAHIANQNIEINIDDGVKINYAKFQNVEVSKEGKKSKKINLLKKL